MLRTAALDAGGGNEASDVLVNFSPRFKGAIPDAQPEFHMPDHSCNVLAKTPEWILPPPSPTPTTFRVIGLDWLGASLLFASEI